MGHIFLILILTVLITGALILPGCRNKKPGSPAEPPAAEKPAPSQNNEKRKLRERLITLKKSSPPKKLKMGAMCYDIAGPPQRIDYICPSCNNKTVYSLDMDKSEGLENRFTVCWIVTYELPFCRRFITGIKGIDITLDEKEFCRTCTPDVKDPSLGIVISYGDEKHTCKGIRDDDLKLIKEFLEGSPVHKGAQDQETPLKDHLPRLQQLLGITIEQE